MRGCLDLSDVSNCELLNVCGADKGGASCFVSSSSLCVAFAMCCTHSCTVKLLQNLMGSSHLSRCVSFLRYICLLTRTKAVLKGSSKLTRSAFE